MTDINHRRKNKKPVNQRYSYYKNGYGAPKEGKSVPQIRIGRTDYLDKSLHGWGRFSSFSDKLIGASIGNDFSNGHRGMAGAVRGAKKYVRSRFRFHEKAMVNKLIKESDY